MGDRKKVLIVDDEPDMRTYVATLLEANGFTSLTAEDGEEGMALARSKRPSLILLDILMPKMSGIMMYRSLQKDPELKDIPVIMLSAISKKSFFHSHKILSRQGAEEMRRPAVYIEKPIEPDELLAAIQDSLKEPALDTEPLP